jgi:hypothetical protein
MARFDSLFRVSFLTLRIAFLCSLLLVASCTKPTVFPRYMTVADVINNVKCELYWAIRQTPNWQWLKGWVAEFSLVLQVKRNTGVNGDLTLVVPYVNPAPGLFTVVAGGTLDKSGTARMSFYFYANKDLNVFMSKDQCAYEPQLRSRRNLAGETGLVLWFGSLIEGINQARIEGQAKSFTYNLAFITTLEGHIKPSYNTMYESGRIFKGVFGANHGRVDTNTLNVSFTRLPPPDVPFAASDLGKALAGIQTELREARRQQDDAEAELDRIARDEKIVKANKMQKSVNNVKKAMKELELSKTTTEKQLRGVKRTRRSLEAERADAVAALAAAAAARPSVSAQQQLNNLTTIEAIRNIPR